ncbi:MULTISPECIES: hydantoinase B/oxoprolinase family protein [Polaromonas]|uniref:Hydantoinase B/oxoprolinase family protein n=1 Tax=Polaromonas aquatica TaxID=332657 RepID=A0ABW1U7G6_9BURK
MNTPLKTAAGQPDAVLTEIIRNGVLAVTEEMKTNLMRTAYNMIIYEALDFTVGLFTAEGETISIGIGLPSFIRGMANTVKAKLAYYGRDGIAPGDILVTNDAYITGSHLNHFTFSQPVFVNGELTAWSCCMAHWPDVGGSLGGVTSDIYSEGLQIPILKYRDGERVNEDLVRIIRTNVRLADRAMGDLRAQIVAVSTGHKRFTELLQRYGREPVLAAIANIMDRSEAAARARTRSIPDGVYEAESFMDDDGLDIGSRVPIKVRVIKKGDELTVDLSEVSPQVRGFFNSGPSTGYSCAQVAYKCLTSPTDYPINEGSFRPLKVILPEGTVVSAVKPAAMRKWMTFPMTVVDTIFKAMVSAIPERTIAAHHADLVIAMFHGIAPKDGQFFIGFVGPTGGGWGAKKTEDGMSGVVCSNDGDTHNSPCEQLESKYPILIERHALRSGSGGAGKHRGGLGTEVVVRARATISVDVQSDRMHCAPWGLEGGHAGLPNVVFVCPKGEDPDAMVTAKIRSQRLRVGDRLYLRAGGGGGFGLPEEREPEMVAHDVAQGYVEANQAAAVYKVQLTDEGLVDVAATAKVRSA